MVEAAENSPNRKTPYIPNPLEAQALKVLGLPWRYYESKDDFDKIVAENQNIIVKDIKIVAENQDIEQTVKNIKTNRWDIARHNACVALTGENSPIGEIDKVEKEIRQNKELWAKIQAAHLYNCAQFGTHKNPLQIDEPYKEESAAAILQKIQEQLNTIEKGKMVDGRYVPSRAEKNVLRALRNYGLFIRNPKDESGIDKFRKQLSNAFQKIAQRENYQIPDTKRKQNTQRKSKNTERNTTMSDTNEQNPKFELNPEQKEVCERLGIDPNGINSVDDYTAAVEKASSSNQPNEENNTPSDEGHENTEDDKDKKNDKNNNNVPLHVETTQPQPEENTDQQEPEWVKRKAEYYSKLSEDKQIAGYERDTTKQGFAAKLENSEIHYSSPDNVTVSPDAGFKVFDSMFKEPDNQGRPIEFPENASKEVATRMYAACVLNGNPMQGAVPQEIDMEELAKCGLSAEQMKQVTDYYKAHNNAQAQEQTQSQEQETGEKTAYVDENIEQLRKIRGDFNNMKKDGKIAIKEIDGKPQIVAGEKGTEEDVKTAKEIMKQASLLVKAGKVNLPNKNLSAEQKEVQETYQQEQIETMRTTMTDEKRQAHDEKQEIRDRIMAARLGITPEDAKVNNLSGKEVKAETGERLQNLQERVGQDKIRMLQQKFGQRRE